MNELIERAKRVCPELLEALEAEAPELVPLYQHRCEYLMKATDKARPSITELNHHALEIITTAARLGILPTEVEKTEQIVVRVPAAMKTALEEVAKKQGKKVSQIVREAIALYLKQLHEANP